MSPLRIHRVAENAPSIAHLLDHTMRVWRPTETLGEARESIRDYGPEPVYSNVPCTVTKKKTALGMQHGGIVAIGGRTLYCLTDVVLLERDVCELVSGPDAPALLEVGARATPRGHHVEAQVVEFQGVVPALGS